VVSVVLVSRLNNTEKITNRRNYSGLFEQVVNNTDLTILTNVYCTYMAKLVSLYTSGQFFVHMLNSLVIQKLDTAYTSHDLVVSELDTVYTSHDLIVSELDTVVDKPQEIWTIQHINQAKQQNRPVRH